MSVDIRRLEYSYILTKAGQCVAGEGYLHKDLELATCCKAMMMVKPKLQ